MPRFQILDERRYPMKMANVRDLLPYWRWEHRATLGKGAREFMVFVDNLDSTVYIEEIVGGHLEKIEDDSLHTALVKFTEENNFRTWLQPLLKDKTDRVI